MKSFQVNKNGERLDLFLKTSLSASRKEAKRLIDAGRIFVNHRKVIIASWKLEKGDRVSLREEKDNTPLPEAAKNYFLKVLFEDDTLLVVEKDAGVPCEPTAMALKPSLPEIIYQYLKRTRPQFSHPPVLSLHRLDQATSGVMVYGKSKAALPLLEDFKRHRIQRRYLALVEGVVKKDTGRIDISLIKNPRARGKKMLPASGTQKGKQALTEYRVLQRYPHHTLLEVTLKTGRTHQVRAHLAELGHPVVGDSIYSYQTGPVLAPSPGSPRFAAVWRGAPCHQATRLVSRLALHASELGFIHPVTHKKLHFRSKPPRAFRDLLDREIKLSVKGRH